MSLQCRRMPSFLAIADFLRPQSLELGSTFIYGVRISFESFSRVFCLAAVNGTMRTPVEGPSIGVLLCESRSGPIVEFALETINQPIGVSTYQVTRELPAPMQEELPTVEDLQEVVNKLRSEIESLRKEAPGEE